VPSPCVHLFLGGHILHTAALNRTGARNFALTVDWEKATVGAPSIAVPIRTEIITRFMLMFLANANAVDDGNKIYVCYMTASTCSRMKSIRLEL
jgi:hypothetical protein